MAARHPIIPRLPGLPVYRGLRSAQPSPVIPNLGVGTDAALMLIGNSLPFGVSEMWWGGPDGTYEGAYGHTVATPFRVDYEGNIDRGIGKGYVIGPTISTQILWDRSEGDWSENDDPRRDLALYDACVIWEGFNGAQGLAQSYFDWDFSGERVQALADVDSEYLFVQAALDAGCKPYLAGPWVPLIEPPDDALWRTRFDGFDHAIRWRREALQQRLRADSLPDDLWIVPTHLMFARFYDDDQNDLLPAGVTSHRDFHALDVVSHEETGDGNHPYMVNPLSAYCAWCMIREAVMGETADTMPPWPVDGVTTEIAAYLRAVASDIVRDYAPAGRGGAGYAAPAIAVATGLTPRTILGANFAGSWVGGVSDVVETDQQVDYGAAVVTVGDVDAFEGEAQLLTVETQAGSIELAFFNYGSPTLVWRFTEGGDQIGSVQMAAPAGQWLFEWRNSADGLHIRRVDLLTGGDDPDKVGTSYVWPPEPMAGQAGSGAITVDPAPAADVTVSALIMAHAIPENMPMGVLSAWVDGHTGLVSWDGIIG